MNPLKKMITRITEPKYDSRTIRNAKKNDLDHIAKTIDVGFLIRSGVQDTFFENRKLDMQTLQVLLTRINDNKYHQNKTVGINPEATAVMVDIITHPKMSSELLEWVSTQDMGTFDTFITYMMRDITLQEVYEHNSSIINEDNYDFVDGYVAANEKIDDLIYGGRLPTEDVYELITSSSHMSYLLKEPLPTKYLKALMYANYDDIRERVARNQNATRQILTELGIDDSLNVRQAVAENKETPQSMLTNLYYHGGDVKLQLAKNPKTPKGILMWLSKTPSAEIQGAVACNPNIDRDDLESLIIRTKVYGQTTDTTRNALRNKQLRPRRHRNRKSRQR